MSDVKCDFIHFFFSALNLSLLVESGSRKIKNSRNPVALALERQSLFRQMECNSLLSLLSIQPMPQYDCLDTTSSIIYIVNSINEINSPPR
jgi:hypothetical protein